MNRHIGNIKADDLMVLRQVLSPRGFSVVAGGGGSGGGSGSGMGRLWSYGMLRMHCIAGRSESIKRDGCAGCAGWYCLSPQDYIIPQDSSSNYKEITHPVAMRWWDTGRCELFCDMSAILFGTAIRWRGWACHDTVERFTVLLSRRVTI